MVSYLKTYALPKRINDTFFFSPFSIRDSTSSPNKQRGWHAVGFQLINKEFHVQFQDNDRANSDFCRKMTGCALQEIQWCDVLLKMCPQCEVIWWEENLAGLVPMRDVLAVSEIGNELELNLYFSLLWKVMPLKGKGGFLMQGEVWQSLCSQCWHGAW